MDSTSKMSTASASLHGLDSPDAVTKSSSSASGQAAPVLSERKTNRQPLLGQDGEKVAFKHYFGDLVLKMLAPLKPSDELTPKDYFRQAAACIVFMQESDQQSATMTLLELLKYRTEVYIREASVMGSGLAGESRKTARDMLGTLKKLAEHERLNFDEDSRASLQKGLTFFETHINREYEWRNDKENGVHAVLLQPKSS